MCHLCTVTVSVTMVVFVNSVNTGWMVVSGLCCPCTVAVSVTVAVFVTGISVNVYLSITSIGELSSKCEEFLAVRSQFDSDHGVDFSAPTWCQSATFVRPLFAFYCPLFFTEKKNNNAALHFMSRMNAVFALDVAIALRQMYR